MLSGPTRSILTRTGQPCTPARQEFVLISDVPGVTSRIAEVGTVTVPALLQAERYPTVLQLTSTVSAQARTDIGVVELFEALYPPGSVTGPPKSAAVGAIATVERRPRGVYCGAVGYLAPGSPAPPLRFAVAIRTLTTSLRSGYAEYGAGGGITWSSDPGDEWAELCVKTRVLCDPPARVGALLELCVTSHRHTWSTWIATSTGSTAPPITSASSTTGGRSRMRCSTQWPDSINPRRSGSGWTTTAQ